MSILNNALEVSLNETTSLVVVTDTQGNSIREESVSSVLLYLILQELKKLNKNQ